MAGYRRRRAVVGFALGRLFKLPGRRGVCENVVYNGKERLDRFFLEIELEQQAAVVSGVGDRVKKNRLHT